jgi:hypothetical protein
MSSQGPKVSGIVKVNDFKLQSLPASVALSAGYAFDKDAIRDAGDWIKYKKQLLVFNENKSKNFQDPWFVHGNDYRLTWLQGRSKQPLTDPVTNCVPCDEGSAFIGNGPF